MAALRRYSWGFIALGALPYVVGIAMAAGAVGVSYYKGYQRGSKSREPEIQELQLAAERGRIAALAAEKRAEAAAQNVRTVYKTKVVEIEKQGESVAAQVEVIKRETTCDLPPSFRVLHDSAAGYPAGDSPAGTVSPAQAAQTIAENYAAAREAAARLEALQSYISQIQEAPAPK